MALDEVWGRVKNVCKQNGLLILSVLAVVIGCLLGFFLRGKQLSEQVSWVNHHGGNTPSPSPGPHPVTSHSIQLCSPRPKYRRDRCKLVFLHVCAPVGAVSTTHQPEYKMTVASFTQSSSLTIFSVALIWQNWCKNTAKSLEIRKVLQKVGKMIVFCPFIKSAAAKALRAHPAGNFTFTRSI